MDSLKLSADVNFVEAAGPDDERKYVRFSIEAYTGSTIRQAWSREPVVIDLAGMDVKQKLPIVMGHDYSLESILGQTDAVRVEGGRLFVEGEILASGEIAEKVIELAKAGYEWQASVGADIGKAVRMSADDTREINGQLQKGPVRIVTASSLREVSLVTLGADGATRVNIAADNSVQEESMSEENTTDLQAEETPVVAEVVKAEAVVAEAPTTEPVDETIELKASLEEFKKEIGTMRELIEARDSRAPAVHAASQVNTDQVREAALCLQAGLRGADAHYSDEVLEAAEKQVRTTSIGEVLVEAARSNGYDGSGRMSSGNVGQVLKAAFATHSITDILSNVANKFLLQGFNAVESTWGDLSAVRSVSDFKSVSMFRLNGDFKFSKIGNGGTLKVAEASDEKRSVNADTYGVVTNISRTDLINDDLNALSAVNSKIGRGAALSMNDVIWSEFANGNASFYSGASAGAGNALSLDSLKEATTAFRKLTDPDGNPLGIAPSQLIVPPDLELAAAELMSSSLLITGKNETRTNVNVLSGRYGVTVSQYLSSASTWWLAANPADLNALDVVFLNGQQSPTIEQVDMDYNVLGIALRGYFDFGVSKAEPNACYRMATS
jgi:phage head maturation protease